MSVRISIQQGDFDIGAEVAALDAENTGAVTTFTGKVRKEGDLTALTLEHYPGMTEREIARIVDDAQTRWPLLGVTVIHRIGRLTPGEKIVLVAVAAQHRHAAAACRSRRRGARARTRLNGARRRDAAGGRRARLAPTAGRNA